MRGGGGGGDGARTKQEAGSKSQKQTRGPVPRAMGGRGKQGTKDKKRPKEKEARWKNVETASPTTILPMRTSEKKARRITTNAKKFKT